MRAAGLREVTAQGQGGEGSMTVGAPSCFVPGTETAVTCNTAASYATGIGNQVSVSVRQPSTFLIPLVSELFGGYLDLDASATAPASSPSPSPTPPGATPGLTPTSTDTDTDTDSGPPVHGAQLLRLLRQRQPVLVDGAPAHRTIRISPVYQYPIGAHAVNGHHRLAQVCGQGRNLR